MKWAPGVSFAQANAVIRGNIVIMQKEGQDKSSRHTHIAPEDLKKLYKSGAFSLNTPINRQNKVYFEVSLHFWSRGREGLRELQKSMTFLNRMQLVTNI